MRVNPEYWEADDDVPSWGYFADGKLYNLYEMPEAGTAMPTKSMWSHSVAALYLLKNNLAWRKRVRDHYTELLPGKQYKYKEGPQFIMLFESAIPAARYLYRETELELTLSATALNDRVVSGVIRNLARAWGNLNAKFFVEWVALDIDSGCDEQAIVPKHFFGIYENPSVVSKLMAAIRGVESVAELNKALQPWMGNDYRR